MVKTKNIIAGLGVVAGLGMAMLPLGAFAETTREQTIKAVVEPTLELTVSNNYGAGTTGGADYVALTRGTENATLIHTIEVAGNTYNDYKLTMNAKTAADVDLRLVKDSTATAAADRYDTNNKIETIATAASSLGTAGWGYKYVHNENYAAGAPTFTGNWNPIPASANDGVIDAASGTRTASYDEYHYVNFGILAAENQVAGTYEAVIEYNVTAAN